MQETCMLKKEENGIIQTQLLYLPAWARRAFPPPEGFLSPHQSNHGTPAGTKQAAACHKVFHATIPLSYKAARQGADAVQWAHNCVCK
eukprot:1156843-Pelagomonas_calceolata.AAC.15